MEAWTGIPAINWARTSRAIRHRDSMENKVLAFFDANPDEELAIADAKAKFSTERVYITRLMKAMSERGLLSRATSGGVLVYRAAAVGERA